MEIKYTTIIATLPLFISLASCLFSQKVNWVSTAIHRSILYGIAEDMKGNYIPLEFSNHPAKYRVIDKNGIEVHTDTLNANSRIIHVDARTVDEILFITANSNIFRFDYSTHKTDLIGHVAEMRDNSLTHVQNMKDHFVFHGTRGPNDTIYSAKCLVNKSTLQTIEYYSQQDEFVTFDVWTGFDASTIELRCNWKQVIQLVKRDSLGDVVWKNHYSRFKDKVNLAGSCYSRFGEIYLCGHLIEDMARQDRLGVIFKISESGDSLWERHYQPHELSKELDFIELHDILETPEGRLLVVGEEGTQSGAKLSEAIILEIDSLGHEISFWSNMLFGEFNSVGHAIWSKDNKLVLGGVTGFNNFPIKDEYAFVAKIGDLHTNIHDGQKRFVHIKPNPVSDNLLVSNLNASGKTTVRLMDSNGRVIRSDGYEIGVYDKLIYKMPSDLIPGPYFLQILEPQTGLIQSVSIIVQ